MNLEIEAAKTEDGVFYRVHFTVEDNRGSNETIRLNIPEQLVTEDFLELDIVRRVRNTIALVLLHELDESLYLDGQRVYDTHGHQEDPEEISYSCLCSSYMCEHSQGKGLIQ